MQSLLTGDLRAQLFHRDLHAGTLEMSYTFPSTDARLSGFWQGIFMQSLLAEIARQSLLAGDLQAGSPSPQRNPGNVPTPFSSTDTSLPGLLAGDLSDAVPSHRRSPCRSRSFPLKNPGYVPTPFPASRSRCHAFSQEIFIPGHVLASFLHIKVPLSDLPAGDLQAEPSYRKSPSKALSQDLSTQDLLPSKKPRGYPDPFPSTHIPLPDLLTRHLHAGRTSFPSINHQRISPPPSQPLKSPSHATSQSSPRSISILQRADPGMF